MESLLRQPLDQKNIGLVKLLYALRQDLDIFSLISVNAENLNQGAGKTFFGHLQQLTLAQIALSICKIYEKEVGNELNSIDGVVNELSKRSHAKLNSTKLKTFVGKYNGPLKLDDQISALKNIILRFRKGYKNPLTEFKTLR